MVDAVQQRLKPHSKVAPQSPLPTPESPLKPPTPIQLKSPTPSAVAASSPFKLAKTPTQTGSKVASPGKANAAGPSSSVVESVQQRSQSHPKVAASPAKPPPPTSSSDRSEPTTLPVVDPAQPLSDALPVHGLAGFIFAVFGELSETAPTTPPQAVHLFCSALIFLVFCVCGTLLLDSEGLEQPWSSLSPLRTAAMTGGFAALASLLATSAQRGAFASATMPPARKGNEAGREADLWLNYAWALNLLLYVAAFLGAFLISHYKLADSQLLVEFPLRASLALLWNLFATEPLAALIAAVAIHLRNHRRWKKRK